MLRILTLFLIIGLVACKSDSTESKTTEEASKGFPAKSVEQVAEESRLKEEADAKLDANNPKAQNPQIYQGLYFFFSDISLITDCGKNVRMVILNDEKSEELEDRYVKLGLESRTPVFVEIEALQKSRTSQQGRVFVDLVLTKIIDFQDIRSCPDDLLESSRFGN